jgi:hypothetical protein
MIKIIAMALSMLLLSANVYAAKVITGDYSHYNDNITIKTAPADTKSEAYANGSKKLKELKSKSSSELNDIFGLFLQSKAGRDSVTIEGANITVEELMDEQGRILYTGHVNVNFHYSRQRNN